MPDDEREGETTALITQRDGDFKQYKPLDKNVKLSSHQAKEKGSIITLEKHITLFQAVCIIVGSVIGAGIFLSPKSVTENIGSVGGSLVIWVVTGVFNFAQALCYAELGTVISKSGGDYVYIYEILGEAPAFLCMWSHLLMVSASGCALISRTAGLYMMEPLGLGCYYSLVTLLAVWIIVTLATINALSARLGSKVTTTFALAKVLALIVVIVTGIVKLCSGYTSNFKNMFKDSSRDPGKIATAILSGTFAYKGWELVNALREEMINPERDLPLAVWISMLLITVIYIMVNVAYFTILSVKDVVSSSAVALTFGRETLGMASIIIPISVSLSCMGAVNSDFLSNSRYLFAAGRVQQVPRVFGFIHFNLHTPILSVIMLALIALIYTIITDLEALQQYSALAMQFKTLLTLVALLYLRWTEPDKHRPFKVNIVVAGVVCFLTTGVIVLIFYQSPLSTVIGCGVFLSGMPVFYLAKYLKRPELSFGTRHEITLVMQKIFHIVPETVMEK